MIVEELIEYFTNNCDHRKIPLIIKKNWKLLISEYDKDDIRDSLARYITLNDVPFPLKEIEHARLIRLFDRFSIVSMLKEYKNFSIVKERYDYKYKYSDNPLGVIDRSHAYNDVSDYFQQENRMKCGSNSVSSPWNIWSDEKKLSKMNWIFWRDGVMGNSAVDDKTFRSSFRLGTYTATQFKPTVAKALYEKHKAKNVLDTSCGWGDRLAGFYATANTHLYVGCDPNPETFEVYKKQCLFYEKTLGFSNKPILIEKEDYFECIGGKTVKIWRKPSEDVDWNLYENTFDFYFTSPPYFETEKYAEDSDKVDDQSWNRYDTFDKWKYDFFFNVTKKVWNTIKDDGFMMINIIEPRSTGNKRLNLCDDMVEYFKEFEKSNYLGKIGMRMAARPNASELADVFIEPIWVFRKNNQNYIETFENTIDKFYN